MECCTVADTRIERSERLCWKDKLGSESPGFNLGQWVKAELQSACVSDTDLHAANNRAAALRLRERIFWQRARFWKNLEPVLMIAAPALESPLQEEHCHFMSAFAISLVLRGSDQVAEVPDAFV